MIGIEFPSVVLVVAALLGLAAMRAFGPLTWSRAIVGAAIGGLVAAALYLVRGHFMIGMPRATAGEASLRQATRDLAGILLGLGAVVGGCVGALFYSVTRVAGRARRDRERTA